ncbi:MAG: hypothetical protein RW306_12905 [Geobacteraceae bacterium]|nr:hypothetical protein [Geobacteraceae bacterium]
MSAIMYRIFDYQPDPKVLSAKFRRWHVEALLNQSADLIEKGLAELREYCSLNSAWRQLSIELDAQEKTLVLDKSRLSYFDRDEEIARIRKSYLDDTQTELGGSVFHADKLYNFQVGEGQGLAGWTRAGQNMQEKHIEARARAMDHQLTDCHIKWGTDDSMYNKSKLNIHEVAIKLKRELTAPGQALALEWQRDLVYERLKQIHEDAYNRSCVAMKGLEQIYGYVAPPLPPSNKSIEAAISELANWIRTSIEWLVAYGQLDQAFTRVISIRSLLDKDVWDQLSESDDQFSVSLQIPSKLFTNHDNVRLRGIAATLLGKAGVIPWSLLIRLPQKAIYQRSGERVKFDQSDLPHCLLGRVENRQSYRPIEVCGLIALANASPIGQTTGEDTKGDEGLWIVKIDRPSGTSESFSKIDDILLEINAVGIPF